MKTVLEAYAQMGLFAQEQGYLTPEGLHVLASLGYMAARGDGDPERALAVQGSSGKFSEAATPPFGEWVSKLNDCQLEAAQGRVALQAAFEPFESAVDNLREEGGVPLSGFERLGAGSYSVAYKHEASDGAMVVLKIPHSTTSTAFEADSKAAAQIALNREKHLETVRAVRYAGGIATLWFPGKQTEYLTPYEIAGIPDESVEALVDAADVADKANVALDPNGNVIYDYSDLSFKLIDLNGVVFKKGNNFTVLARMAARIGTYQFMDEYGPVFAHYNDSPEGEIFRGKVLDALRNRYGESSTIARQAGKFIDKLTTEPNMLGPAEATE